MDQSSIHQPLILKEEAFAVMGVCFEVYKSLGHGFLESVYHEALALEFSVKNIPFISRMPLSISYKGVVLEQGFAVDFLLFGKIVLEIKSAVSLCEAHEAQLFNYLRASGCELGLLVNFGGYPKLEWKRIVCTEGRYRNTERRSSFPENNREKG